MSAFRACQLATRHIGPVDFACAAGECIAIQGASGSGKTLLLRAMADLDPHDGELFVDDLACSGLPAEQWRRRVALVMAESQWWYDTVGEHFPQALDEASLAALGLPPEAPGWAVARCSTGERQRLALLRSLMQQPGVLLLDEPTGNLDETSTARVEALLERYRRERGAALIWVSHDDRQVGRVAQRAFRLHDGRLQQRSPACT